MVTVRVSKEHTSNNLADLFTKTMAALKIQGILENYILRGKLEYVVFLP